MAAGYYPLDPREPGGAALKKIADDLRELLHKRGEHGILPAAYDNDQYDNAAFDGQYEGYLFLAAELIERCIEKIAGAEARRDAMREAYEKVLAICAECDDVVLVEDAVRGLIADLD